MGDVKEREDIKLDGLEDIFNEPHCESPHKSPINRECSHQVVARLFLPCGCTTPVCALQVNYSRQMREGRHGPLANCGLCGAVNMRVKDIIIRMK